MQTGTPVPGGVRTRTRVRDVALTFIPISLVASVFAYRGDVVHPRGTDLDHPLGHFATLVHSGHVPFSVPICLLLLTVSIVGVLGWLGDSPLDLRGSESPFTWPTVGTLLRREGARVVLLSLVVLLPLAGAYGLWDPWETHYAEVSREVLSRDDWITLWWGQEGWFMSKPVLLFWLSALGMDFGSGFGLSFWSGMGPGSHEWFIRVPIVLLATGAVYALYRAVAHAWGRRAGLCVGVVLVTMPHWFLLAHQAMTDMPFIATLTLAMSFLIVAVTTDADAVVRDYVVPLGRWRARLSAWHAALAAILVVTTPQLLWLATRPVVFRCDSGDGGCEAALHASRLGSLQFPVERFWSGSAGNSLPAFEGHSPAGASPWEAKFSAIPFATSVEQSVVWLIVAAWVLRALRGERSSRRLAFLMAFLFAGLAVLAKGPAGVGIPALVLGVFLVVTRRGSVVRDAGMLRGVAVTALCALPWYGAIFARLGRPFVDRFVVHDLLDRAFAGVHGDTGTFGYYVEQLGFSTFPWVALLPFALGGTALYVATDAPRAQRDLVRLVHIWFFVTFAIFSLMVTRFHHYIAPIAPPAAVCVGLLLDRIVGATRIVRSRTWALQIASVVAVVVGVATSVGDARGRNGPPHAALGVALVLVGAMAWFRSLRKPSIEVADGGSSTPLAFRVSAEPVAAGGASPPAVARTWTTLALSAATVLSIVTADLAARDARPLGSERLLQLFSYDYTRAFPTAQFDYRPILVAFGAVAIVLAGMFGIARARHDAARSFGVLAFGFALWSLDVYMIDLSRHWSQRGIFERYRELGGADEAPVVALQMNWKGETFYTGNHAPALECGLPFCGGEEEARWWREARGQHVFFVTESTRAPSLIQRIAHGGGVARRVTDQADNAKFTLIDSHIGAGGSR